MTIFPTIPNTLLILISTYYSREAGKHTHTHPQTPRTRTIDRPLSYRLGVMDITNFVVSARNQALLYGDYGTYHSQLAKKLHNCRRKLNLSVKNRGKYTKKSAVTAEQIAENHG